MGNEILTVNFWGGFEKKALLTVSKQTAHAATTSSAERKKNRETLREHFKSHGFWRGLVAPVSEKQAGLAGQMFARAAGRGAAVSRLNKIRSVAPDAFKPQNLLGQIIENPQKGFANAAARHSAAWHSPKEKALRVVGGTTVGVGGLAYGMNKLDPDRDKQPGVPA